MSNHLEELKLMFGKIHPVVKIKLDEFLNTLDYTEVILFTKDLSELDSKYQEGYDNGYDEGYDAGESDSKKSNTTEKKG